MPIMLDEDRPEKTQETREFTAICMEEAKSGRAKCKICSQNIEGGTTRVGVERFAGGRIVIAWLHPKCFLMNTQVSIADSNRGKCKFSKKKIEKGDLRFGWRIGEETWVNCLVDHVHDTVVPAALAARDDFKATDITGMSGLTPADRARMLDALGGRSPPGEGGKGKEQGGKGGGKLLESKASCHSASLARQGFEVAHPAAAEKACGTKTGKVLASKGVKVLASKSAENSAKAQDGANLKKRASSEQSTGPEKKAKA